MPTPLIHISFVASPALHPCIAKYVHLLSASLVLTWLQKTEEYTADTTVVNEKHAEEKVDVIGVEIAEVAGGMVCF